jgi:hypothetical protein
MALFDFLSSYAMSPQQASAAIPAINDPGGVGVQAAVPAVAGRPGFTYGDVASALMQYGSKPGSTGANIGRSLGEAYGADAVAQKQQPVGQLVDFGPTVQEQQKQKSADSMSNVMKIFMSVFGVPMG